MSELPILKFEPVYKETVWGGRRLQELLGKELPGDGPFGESWEVVDLPGDQSRVVGGALAGATLGQLREERQAELLGGAPLLEGRFPLLLKFIDARQTLSVQVHPDEAACARLGGGARPKTEAWFILGADPGAELYVGLEPGVGRPDLEAAIEAGTVEELLHRVPVSPGDFVFLPSGTIHAIGEGILLAEVQQSSDTTYRVFDWNRVGLDGKPRQLHVAEALESVSFDSPGVPRSDPPPSGRSGIACADFVMERVELSGGEEAILEGDGPLVLMGIGGAGDVEVRAGGSLAVLGRGGSVLVPAAAAGATSLRARGEADLLATRIPA